MVIQSTSLNCSYNATEIYQYFKVSFLKTLNHCLDEGLHLIPSLGIEILLLKISIVFSLMEWNAKMVDLTLSHTEAGEKF